MTMTQKQLRSAHSLAAAHGHDWANLTVGAYLAATTHNITPAELYAADLDATVSADLRDGYNTQWLGGVAPTAAHTTGTGRTRWLVRPDGAVEVVITRPDPDGASDGVVVLEALIGADGAVIAARSRGTRECRAEGRHLDALASVITALGGDAGGLLAIVDDDRLTATVLASREAEEAANAAAMAARAEVERPNDQDRLERDAILGKIWAGEATPADVERRDALNALLCRAWEAEQAARKETFSQVFEASYRTRLAALRAKRDASPEAEERRYQAARREAMERAGVSL